MEDIRQETDQELEMHMWQRGGIIMQITSGWNPLSSLVYCPTTLLLLGLDIADT